MAIRFKKLAGRIPNVKRKVVPLLIGAAILLLLLSVSPSSRLLRVSQPVHGKATSSDVAAARDAEHERVKSQLRAAALEAVPALRSATTDWDRAVVLRNHVYSGTHVGRSSSAPVPFSVEHYKAIVSGKSPQLCGGMTVTYLGLLEAFGIPGRWATFASDTLKDTHAAVEVFLNGRWVLQDPTFNVHWEFEGEPVGAQGLREAFLNGANPVSSSDGFELLPRRSVHEYFIPYRDLLARMEISEFETMGPQAGMTRVIKTYPPGPTWRYAYYQASFLATTKAHVAKVISWRFKDGLPHGWGTLPAAIVTRNPETGGISVTTDESNHHYQLWSPDIPLDAGNYQVRLRGSVPNGGLQVLALDAAANESLALERYWHGQNRESSKADMGVTFNLAKRTSVRIILGNWSYEKTRSSWNIRQIEISSTRL